MPGTPRRVRRHVVKSGAAFKVYCGGSIGQHTYCLPARLPCDLEDLSTQSLAIYRHPRFFLKATTWHLIGLAAQAESKCCNW